MNILHHGNWRVSGYLTDDRDCEVTVYECPACFALTGDPMAHADFHAATRTAYPYRGRE